MTEQIVIYWRDIPSQLNLRRGRAKAKLLLGERFQQAIDRAAMYAGKADTEAYVAEWRRESTEVECEADLDQCAARLLSALEARFSDAWLDQVVRNGGVLPTS